MTTNLQPWEQLPMYALSDEVAARVDALGLSENIRELQETGFTVVPVSRELTDRVRAAVLRLAEDSNDADTAFERNCAEIVGQDPAVDEAILHPIAMTLAEVMCGKGFNLSAVLGTVRGPGTKTLPLHSDQSFLPSPFPEHNVSFTACWITDEFTEAAGATTVVPGTHRLRRPPSPPESAAAEGIQNIVSSPGAIAFWDGSVWHGSSPRTLPGERVVLHVTYLRLAYRTMHQFNYLSDEYRASAPPEMRQLLGSELGFGSNGPHLHFDTHKVFRMTAMAKR